LSQLATLDQLGYELLGLVAAQGHRTYASQHDFAQQLDKRVADIFAFLSYIAHLNFDFFGHDNTS
jgi:hypothetical protein